MHLLLIQDDPSVAHGVAAGLRMHGFTVDHTESAAVSALRNLLDDAVRASPQGAPVELRIGSGAESHSAMAAR